MERIKPLTVKKFKTLMELGFWSGAYRHPEIEKRYQGRNKKNDPINYHNKTFEWLPNNYPYYWEKGIEHWLLWYHGDWKELEENHEKWILKFTKTYVIAWVNPPHLRSISNFPHCHVLLTKKNFSATKREKSNLNPLSQPIKIIEENN
jgi:hypothetical protein